MSDPTGPIDPPEGAAPPPEGAGQGPAEPAPPEQVRDARREVAKNGYELGYSLRNIGAQAGVSEAAVRNWAKEEGWVRGTRAPVSKNPVHKPPKPPKPPRKPAIVDAADAADAADVSPKPSKLSNVIALPSRMAGATSQKPPCEVVEPDPESAKCEVDAKLGHEQPLDEIFRERVRELLTNPSRDEAADVAARAVVQVVREHRRSIVKAQALVERLLGQLDVATLTRSELEEFILESTKPGLYRATLMKMVQLPAHASTLKDLSQAMSRLTAIERQAFGLGQFADPTPPQEPEAAPQVDQDEFERIRQRARLRLADQSGEAP